MRDVAQTLVSAGSRLASTGGRRDEPGGGRQDRLRHMVFLILASSAISLFAQTAHQHHPPQSAEEYASVLEDPGRDEWQKPHEVITALRLQPGDIVADIGAGTGYFARRFALHSAKVYAVDIDAKLLAIAAQKAPRNLVTILSKPDDPLLPAASVDLIFFCDVLHHLNDRPAYYRRMSRALKSQGRVVVVDFRKPAMLIGPPPEMKLDEETVVREFREAGFTLQRSEAFLPYQYFLEFTRLPVASQP